MKKTQYLILLICLFTFSGVFSQQLTTVNPAEGERDNTLGVTISGQYTHFAQGSQTVYFNQGSSTLFPNYFFPIDDQNMQTQFSISNSTPLGYWDVNIFNAIDGHLIKTDGFLVKENPNQPHIVMADPDSAKQGENLKVTITGQNTSFFAQGTETVWFSQGTGTIIKPTNATVVSNTQIDADFAIPLFAPLGYYDVNTFDLIDGHLMKPDGFKILKNTVSLKEIDDLLQYDIYPNPITRFVNVRINPKLPTTISITLLDIGGRTIYISRQKIISSLYETTIDLSNISKGTYFMRINAGTATETKLIIKE